MILNLLRFSWDQPPEDRSVQFFPVYAVMADASATWERAINGDVPWPNVTLPSWLNYEKSQAWPETGRLTPTIIFCSDIMVFGHDKNLAIPS